MLHEKGNINRLNNVALRSNKKKTVVNRINLTTHENHSKKKKIKFKFYKKKTMRNMDAGPADLGKGTNPVAITNWRFYLNVAKESFEKRYKFEGAFHLSFGNFHIIKSLAKGKFSRVMVVSKDDDNKLYALKVISLKKVRKYNKMEQLNNEKAILSAMRFPFVMNIECISKSESSLNFILPLLAGGDFFSYLQKKEILDEIQAAFYAAQMVLALEYLHYLNIVFRDLKPENIMMDHLGYIKLTSFTLAKVIENNRTYTFCGTPEYVAPEILRNEGYGVSCDWWSLGCVIFEMCAGRVPFVCADVTELYNKILTGKCSCPAYFSSELKSLIRGLLKPDLTERIGNLKDGVNGLKDHEWFSRTGWMSIVNYSTKPPYLPAKEEISSVTYYQEYIAEKSHEKYEYDKTFDGYIQNV